MKLITHNLFSIGLMVYIVSFLGYPLLITIILIIAATILTNVLIDEVGHVHVGGVSTRAWVTHSIITAPFWGGAAWALTLIIPAALVGVFPPDLTFLGFFVALGMLAGCSHLLLDSVTEGGVFAFDGRRRAVAHVSYDNPALNLGCSALGLTLLLVALFL